MNMKKLFLILLTTLSAWVAQAQIPNPGFENWNEINIPGASYKDPSGWTSSNVMLTFAGIEEAAVVPSTDAYAGTYALLLRNIENPEKMISFASSMQLQGMEYIDKFPVQGKPTALRGFHKYTYQDKDTFTISVVLFKNGNVIGSGNLQSDSQVTSYTPFAVPIQYDQGNENEIPDSANIYISVGMSGREVMNQTVNLWVDELSFDGISTGFDDDLTAQLRKTEVYPVPATDQITIVFNQAIRGTKTFKLYSIMGAEITSLTTTREFAPGDQRIQLPVSELTPGIYWLEVSELNSIHTIRISVQ